MIGAEPVTIARTLSSPMRASSGRKTRAFQKGQRLSLCRRMRAFFASKAMWKALRTTTLVRATSSLTFPMSRSSTRGTDAKTDGRSARKSSTMRRVSPDEKPMPIPSAMHAVCMKCSNTCAIGRYEM